MGSCIDKEMNNGKKSNIQAPPTSPPNSSIATPLKAQTDPADPLLQENPPCVKYAYMPVPQKQVTRQTPMRYSMPLAQMAPAVTDEFQNPKLNFLDEPGKVKSPSSRTLTLTTLGNNRKKKKKKKKKKKRKKSSKSKSKGKGKDHALAKLNVALLSSSDDSTEDNRNGKKKQRAYDAVSSGLEKFKSMLGPQTPHSPLSGLAHSPQEADPNDPYAAGVIRKHPVLSVSPEGFITVYKEGERYYKPEMEYNIGLKPVPGELANMKDVEDNKKRPMKIEHVLQLPPSSVRGPPPLTPFPEPKRTMIVAHLAAPKMDWSQNRSLSRSSSSTNELLAAVPLVDWGIEESEDVPNFPRRLSRRHSRHRKDYIH